MALVLSINGRTRAPACGHGSCSTPRSAPWIHARPLRLQSGWSPAPDAGNGFRGVQALAVSVRTRQGSQAVHEAQDVAALPQTAPAVPAQAGFPPAPAGAAIAPAAPSSPAVPAAVPSSVPAARAEPAVAGQDAQPPAGDGGGSSNRSSNAPVLRLAEDGSSSSSSSSPAPRLPGRRRQLNPRHAALAAYEQESKRLLRRLQELQALKQQAIGELMAEEEARKDAAAAVAAAAGSGLPHAGTAATAASAAAGALAAADGAAGGGGAFSAISRQSQAHLTDLEEATKRIIFPFTAIVGQEEMKLSLILNVIDPKIGGVMIMGDRGTGKTTAVRALADLLPEMKVVDKDPFNSDPDDPDLMGEEVRAAVRAGQPLAVTWMKIPMVDLPLGATEDRVCGTIDIEKALAEGVKAFEPGLLAKANRGILYVDEVNLLDDHLVDVLLDSAASGWNTVEREGISISHPARFILVGSGNPEEGELRPQLLDRFGMHAAIRTVRDPVLRVQIVAERSKFDEDPVAFCARYDEKQHNLTRRIIEAQKLARRVQLPYEFKVRISQVCTELNVDGIRGDIVTNRAAKALAAFEGRSEVAVEDIYRVIPLCLRHRLRKDPLADIDDGDRVRDVFKRVFAVD